MIYIKKKGWVYNTPIDFKNVKFYFFFFFFFAAAFFAGFFFAAGFFFLAAISINSFFNN